MTFAQFAAIVQQPSAPFPPGWSGALQALGHDARGQWEDAHTCAQEDHSRDGSWVHAYLHRKEGDEANAGYWYARAGRPMPGRSLQEEWTLIAEELVGRSAEA